MIQFNKNILLVEDEALIALSEKMALEKCGYAVSIVHSGESSIQHIRQNHDIDLILMDIDLGKGIDGTEAAQKILAIKDIPIVFLSSHTEPEVVQRTEKITSYGYVVKNSGITILDASIKMAFKLYSSNQKLLASEENLRTTLNSIGDAVISLDLNKQIVWMNQEAENLTGWCIDEAKGRSWVDALSIKNNRSYDLETNPVDLVLECKKTIRMSSQTAYTLKNKKNYQISTSAAPISNSMGEMTGIVLVIRDVSKEYQIREKLRQNQKFQNDVFSCIQDGISLLDRDLNICLCNSKMEEWYKANLPLNGKKCFFCYHNNAKPCNPCPTLRSFNSGNIEMDIVRGLPGSDVEWLEVYSYPIRDMNSDEITSVVEFVRDITHERRIEEQAKKENKRNKELSFILNQSPAVTFSWQNKEGWPVEFVTDNVNKFGYTVQEFVSGEILYSDIIHPDDLNRVIQEVEKHSQSEKETFTQAYRIFDKKGRIHYIDDRTWICRNNNNEITHFQGILWDVTKSRINELELEKANNEKAIILREVHHRVKNNMRTIQAILSLLTSKTECESAKTVLKAAHDRINSMILLYNKIYQKGKFKNMLLHDYMIPLIHDISNLYVQEVELNIQLEPLLLPVRILFPLGIILNEIISNSMKHAFRNNSENQLNIKAYKDDDLLKIIIYDNGPGCHSHVKGFGLELVEILSRQIDAKFSIKSDHGAHIILDIQLTEFANKLNMPKEKTS